MRSGIALFLLCPLAAALLISCAPSGSALRGEEGVSDPVMGDWQGHGVSKDGIVEPFAVQAIALGNDTYRFVVRDGFPPGNQRSPDSRPFEVDATLKGDQFTVANHPDWTVWMDKGMIKGRTSSPGPESFGLRRIVRPSPNLGAMPPPGAVILFDGSSLTGWERRDPKMRETPVGWTITDGVLNVVPGTGDIMTKKKFSDFQMHLEFRTPFMPDARGQERGNSGVYLQGRYEVQVLDSYGLKGEDNECGGIYRMSAPRVNMCAPPGQWQSYDITFHAPRFDPDGTKTKDAVVTVNHNGVLVQGHVAVPGVTGGAVDEDLKSPGALLLQDHGNLVQYRNIWLVELNP